MFLIYLLHRFKLPLDVRIPMATHSIGSDQLSGGGTRPLIVALFLVKTKPVNVSIQGMGSLSGPISSHGHNNILFLQIISHVCDYSSTGVKDQQITRTFTATLTPQTSGEMRTTSQKPPSPRFETRFSSSSGPTRISMRVARHLPAPCPQVLRTGSGKGIP